MPPLAASGVTAPNQPAPDRSAPETAGTLLDRVRASAPLVHSITNNVVTNFTANALLALGAAPAMVDIVGEAGMFARVASGLLVNLGTPTPEQRGAIAEAVAGAREAGTPWVLDPVAIGALPIRTALAAELVTQRPTAVRGNPSEVLALAGAGSGGRGVESSDTAASARDAAVELARRFGTVVAVSGEEDCITDGHSVVWVSGGDALLTKVTGGGCALGAIVAALLAVRVEHSVLDAVVAAHASYGVAAKRAASRADGPGSFAVELLDALAAITPQQVVDESRWRVELVGDSAASVPVAAVPVDAAPAEAAGDAA